MQHCDNKTRDFLFSHKFYHSFDLDLQNSILFYQKTRDFLHLLLINVLINVCSKTKL
jgi:hypothetical protein